MAQPNSALTPPYVAPPEPVTEEPSWNDVVQLLHQAAQLAAERGTDTDRFMQAAWVACLDARPGLREELEDRELLVQIAKLRQRGMVAGA